MAGMFAKCEEIEHIDLTNFNTSNVINMRSMFDGCYNLKKIKGINNFNISKVTNMKSKFQL